MPKEESASAYQALERTMHKAALRKKNHVTCLDGEWMWLTGTARVSDTKEMTPSTPQT